MPLTQTQELELAQKRITEGTASDADKANVAYAKSKGMLGDTIVANPEKSSGGSLDNTLTSKPDTFEQLQTAVRKASELALSQSGGARRGLNIASEAGVDLFNPANIRGGIEMGSSVKNDIKDIYQSTLDRIDSMKTARKEGAQYLAKLAVEVPDFFQQLSPDEISFIQQSGFVSEVTAAKLAQYKLDNPDGDTKVDIQRSTDSRGNVITIARDKVTGETLWQTTDEGAGKPQQAPVSIIMNQQQGGMIGDASAILDSSTGSDGYVNTSVYSQQRDQFAANGGDVGKFDETFKYRLNPDDPSAQRFLSKSEVDLYAGSGSYTQEQRDALISFGVDESLVDQAELAGIPFSELMGN